MYYLFISVLLIASIFVIKSRIIQLIMIFMIYPIICTAVISYSGETTRIIANMGLRYYSDYYQQAYIYQVIFFCCMFFCFLFIRKKIFFIQRLPLSEGVRLLILFFLIILYPIAYPAIFGFGESRFGGGGSLLILMNSFILLSRKKNLNVSDFGCLGINLFALLSGERADTILIVALYYLLESRDGIVYEKKISIIKLAALLISVMLVGLISGINRMGGGITVQYILYYIFNQGTAIDVLHVYFSSIWYINNIGHNLTPILNFISSFIPFNSLGGASSDFNVTQILAKEIPNVGGGMFYSLGVIVGGYIGGIVVVFLFSLALASFFVGNRMFKVIFISLFLQQLRLQWYGLTYMGNVVSFGLLLIIFLYFIYSLCNLKSH